MIFLRGVPGKLKAVYDGLVALASVANAIKANTDLFTSTRAAKIDTTKDNTDSLLARVPSNAATLLGRLDGSVSSVLTAIGAIPSSSPTYYHLSVALSGQSTATINIGATVTKTKTNIHPVRTSGLAVGAAVFPAGGTTATQVNLTMSANVTGTVYVTLESWS